MLRGKGRLLLRAQQTPQVGVALAIGTLRVNEGHIRVKRRHNGDRPVAIGTVDKANVGVDTEAMSLPV